MQTYAVSFTSEGTYQLDSRNGKGGERSRTLKALATSRVSQTATCVSFSSHAAHFTHSSRMFAFFLPGQEREWIQAALCFSAACCRQWGRGGHLSLFYLVQCSCPVISFLLKFLLFPVSTYVLTIKKKRSPHAFISSVTVGILTKDFSSGHGSNECPATSCYQWLHNVRKLRHPCSSNWKWGDPSMRPWREMDEEMIVSTTAEAKL